MTWGCPLEVIIAKPTQWTPILHCVVRKPFHRFAPLGDRASRHEPLVPVRSRLFETRVGNSPGCQPTDMVIIREMR